jgi:hypothetical protein
MGSKNGTYINRQRITGEVPLQPDDRVKIVKYLLEWEKYFPASSNRQTTAKILTIGRNQDNNIVINDTLVSHHHAQLVQHSNGMVSISDMGSSNGTFVNGKRIYGETQLYSGYTVQIGNSPLLWNRYVPIGTSGNVVSFPNKLWWWIGSAAASVLLLIALGTFLYLHQYPINRFNSNETVLFTGKYPPVKIITYTENGKNFETEGIERQVIMFFQDGTTYESATKLIRQNGGKIVAQMPKYDYFLVETGKNKEGEFIEKMKQKPEVSYAYLNMPLYPCSPDELSCTEYHPIDVFSQNKKEKMKHGDKVEKTFKDNSNSDKVNIIQHSGSGVYDTEHYMNDDKACSYMMTKHVRI